MRPGPPPDAGDAAAAEAQTSVVVAWVQEAADVWNDQGKKADSYHSTYKVEYSMVQASKGSWRIYRSLVLGG